MSDLCGFVELVEELVQRLDAVVQSKRLGVLTEKLRQFQPHLFKSRHLAVDHRQLTLGLLHDTAQPLTIRNVSSPIDLQTHNPVTL